MSEDSEQDKTEEPTPFKLKKAREKGQIAKGMDLPFFGTLLALTLFALIFGDDTVDSLKQSMRDLLRTEVGSGSSTIVITAIRDTYFPAFRILLILGAMTTSFILLAQLLQTKGLLFTAHPLKPDFSKLNPAKGLKRIFSMRTLKEALKNILKMSIYLIATYWVAQDALERFARTVDDASSLSSAIYQSGLRLLLLYVILSMIFAAIDQVIVRKEFMKQMRMSRRELKREVKDREGEPRMKQKRKKLHEEFAKSTGSMGELPGSDVLVVNPQHFAVALSYDVQTMSAPVVTAKGRNRFALELKDRAYRLGIPIIPSPPLARALHKRVEPSRPVPPDLFQDTAYVYMRIARDTMKVDAPTDDADNLPERPETQPAPEDVGES